ncbi:MAG: glucans biosynthesis glucosyltransferase MdoH [Burkholderiales bacterium]|nr:glucans biosynthesis glucosyltransferase MdoH [Burkholderiales bacterium]
MELHHSHRRLSEEGDAPERYARRLPLDSARRQALLQQAGGRDPQESMAGLHRALAGHDVDPGNPSYASVAPRLKLACGTPAGDSADNEHARHGARLPTMPPLNRSSMAPHPTWPGAPARRHAAQDLPDASPPDPRGHWQRTANRRRIVLLALVLLQTWFATGYMADVLPYDGRQPLEIAILILFMVLFGWISAGFWTALAGFALLCRRRDPHAISATAAGDAPIDPAARTAIIMPIYNEDVPRVFAGLRATYESLQRANGLQHFDFYVLSDSSDPDTRVAETAAWTELCRSLNAFGRVFYRWRRHRIKCKSGNVADFCRRWGSNYRYMVVMDADSVMTGECLMQLVRLMEANAGAGIIQTVPCAVGRDTLHARVQQFASRVYGPLFTAGLHFWQLGESHYWGHNAIIRVAPFIRHCALGRLPGRGSLSGEILSHDFVEAALMRRAGWGVWIAYDLPGSYEEMPPNLIDELTRDRRWCQGNLMNSRLLPMKGLHPAHRAVFVTGVMAYLSAPLWLLMLILSTALLAVHMLVAPEYFTAPHQLFPLWPAWRPERAVALFSATATLLFLPKILSVLLISIRGAKPYGGVPRLVAGMLGEMAVSMLLAPIRMLFHARFVAAALSGWHVKWKSPSREDAETTWGEALRRHGWHTLFGVAWATGIYWLHPASLWWLLPVAGAMMISIPLSVYTSRASLGRSLRRAGLFLTPEEYRTPREIASLQQAIERAAATPGFADAIVDPVVNAIACASGVVRPGQPAHVRAERHRLVEAAVSRGPDALTTQQKMILLGDPLALSRLHFQAWTGNTAPAGPQGDTRQKPGTAAATPAMLKTAPTMG